jgi:hypothetical protein
VTDPFVGNPTRLPTPMHINWYRFVDARMPQYRDDVDWMAVYRHRPLATIEEPAGFASPGWREELRHRTIDGWWEPVRYQHRIGEVDLPVLHVSGWHDDEEIGTPANFAVLAAISALGRPCARRTFEGCGLSALRLALPRLLRPAGACKLRPRRQHT